MKDNSVHTVWIGLGTNLGDRASNLKKAAIALEDIGCRIMQSSFIYESAPWGYQSKNNFYNQCLVLETDVHVFDLLKLFKRIEASFGRRKSTGEYTDRPLDIDILFYDDQLIDSDELKVPHPGIKNRNFVLTPLLDISPEKMHPTLKKTIAELAKLNEDQQGVTRLLDE